MGRAFLRESGSSGNLSPYTAHGCLVGAEAAFGSADVTGKHVAVQDVGAVGGALAILLKERGAKVTICDIYAPCARGAGINDETNPRLKCKVIAGCANNVLAEERHGQVLCEEGILHAPDHVINAGGLINVSVEVSEGGYNETEAMRRINNISEALRQVYAISSEENMPTAEAADRLAERRLAAGRVH